jgi:hypothetical protein
MYKVQFLDNTTKKVGKQPASLWIELMKRDSEYWDWAWDRLIQASQDYDLIIDKSVITFCDKD